eukprot:3538996-Prymnesium_polylepis.1
MMYVPLMTNGRASAQGDAAAFLTAHHGDMFRERLLDRGATRRRSPERAESRRHAVLGLFGVPSG